MRLTPPTLAEVHVWRVLLDTDQTRQAELLTLLSEEERLRAGRFHFAVDQERWSAARGSLRQVLGGYLGVLPSTVCFETSPFGKPSLGSHPLRFNLSHSGGLALFAVAWEREVGVDVERLRTDFVPEELAAQVFSLPEQAWLSTISPGERCAAFLALWTGKEAYVKARGEGLSFPVADLTLRIEIGSEELSVEDRTDNGAQTPFSLRRLTLAEGYVGALAAEGPPFGICCFDHVS